MIQVKNKKAIRNLADKSFRANRARNIITTIAIAPDCGTFHCIIYYGNRYGGKLTKGHYASDRRGRSRSAEIHYRRGI